MYLLKKIIGTGSSWSSFKSGDIDSENHSVHVVILKINSIKRNMRTDGHIIAMNIKEFINEKSKKVKHIL